MGALAGLEQRFCLRIIKVTHLVDPGSGGVDHLPRGNLQVASRALVAGAHTGDSATRRREADSSDVVGEAGAAIGRRLEHLDAQAGVIHLGVEKLGTATQAIAPQVVALAKQLSTGERPVSSKVVAAGED